ncbi:SURF1 family protein [Sphingomonas lutea]|uniref:SURF1-like protein n=1 Tax=Sphingomonas lutea TaxID=1045317 RepID=A0A7G9SKX4_9SPHN|nr:SURF1 family protein [Sphingomonas lutea]QNN68499.1 SURF1 family protein [Sphingomonas lutea]
MRAGRLVLPALCLAFALLFGALGVWQVERLRWKLDLIERVETRLAQSAVDVPATIDPKQFEYRRVRVSGTFLHDRETLVEALTEHGPGHWVMTPLRTERGLILINRGFVPQGRTAVGTDRQAQVEGLVRLSEPKGRFLRANRPAENRWYSRDVAAIAEARDLGSIAPFFIDAGPGQNTGGLPIGGLTIVRFRNAHLIYALTWFGLAGLSAFGMRLAFHTARGQRRAAGGR